MRRQMKFESPLEAAKFLFGSLDGAASPDVTFETYKDIVIVRDKRYGKLAAAYFRGTSMNPVKHFSFRSVERMEAFVAEAKAGEDAIHEYKETRKAAKAAARENFVNPYKVGDFLYTSWGYDQTNVDYYQVVKVSDRSVWLAKSGGRVVEANGPAGNKVVATKAANEAVKNAKRHVVGSGGYVNIDGHTGSKWDGTPKYETDIMYGH